jgi:serine/threonine protein kinase
LSHPNIVTAFDADQAGGQHFLVMEHVAGVDLDRKVKQTGPLPIRRACHFARQAALGLQHALEKGMVHRDIKPQNLMLTGEGRVKILDFGLARFASEVSIDGQTIAGNDGGLTQDGIALGTPDYMAPEQCIDSRTADIRADIYSLGCTLYFLLTGQLPFPHGSAIEKISAHLERTPQPLTELRGDVPPELAAVVQRMMARDPAQRFQTPNEVAAALAPFAQQGRSPTAGQLIADRRLVQHTAQSAAFVAAVAFSTCAGRYGRRRDDDHYRLAVLFSPTVAR